MAVKYYDLNFDSRRTYLGNVGYFDENEYRALRINVASVLEDYPNASFKVILQRANDTHPYEKATSDVTLLDDKLVASLNETDYNKPGRLLVQVTFTSGEVTGKSGIFIADVGKSLSSDTTDPQSPYADALKEIDDALEKIDDFLATGGGAISSEIIEEAVSNYLEENPISETDPTVPAWAKAAEKPSYSYNELTDKPTIPDAYTLPVASESTLGGVKPISKTDDMTQSVGVDSEGKLWALPGGGSESTGGSTGGIPAVTTEGTGAAYTATIPEITELYAGLLIAVKFHTSNKASATLNVNGLGAYSIYTQVANRSNTTNEAIPLNYVGTSGIHLMMFNGSSWKLFYTTKVNVNAGGTGLTSLTSGSYLVGNSTSAVTLKTPAQVLADILPSTTDDVGKVPTVQEDGTIALAEISGGGGTDYAFLSGKKYYAFGDSIVDMQGTLAAPETFGDTGYSTDLQSRNISDITVEGYVTAIERRYGLVATNYGKGGQTLVSGYATLAALDYSDVALVTIAYGVNDARTGVPLGTMNSTDITTFAGAMNQLLRKIYTDNPECRVVVLTPIQRLYVSEFGIATPNANGNYLVDFVDMCKKVAAKRSTKCIDMYRDSGINQTNLYYYTVEGVHPVNQGFARMRGAVIPVLDDMFAMEFEPFGTMTNTGDTEPEEPDTGGDTGGGDTPEEDDAATVVDLSGMFTEEGLDIDGWGTGANNTEYQHAHYTDIVPSKTYTLITYKPVDNTDERGAISWSILNEDGTVKTGNYMTNNNSCATGYTYVIEGNETIDGTEYQRIKVTFTTNATITEGMRYNIGCLDACIDHVVLSYV